MLAAMNLLLVHLGRYREPASADSAKSAGLRRELSLDARYVREWPRAQAVSTGHVTAATRT